MSVATASPLTPGNWTASISGLSQLWYTSVPAPMSSHPTGPAIKSVALRYAVEATVAEKTRMNRRASYVKGLGCYLRAFIRGREEGLIADITTEDVERWFNDRGEKTSARTSNGGRLSAMFGLAVRRRWVTENPILRIDKGVVERANPSIFTPEQVEKVLKLTARHHPRWLAYVVLAVFAGVRPDEIMRSKWSDFKGDVFVIDAAASKVRRRRVVHLEPTAIKWLRFARKQGADLGGLSVMGRRRWLKRMKHHFRLKEWPQDVLRHTAATFLLTRFQDAGKVALWLGNSPGILLRHYNGLATSRQSERFWAITPAIV